MIRLTDLSLSFGEKVILKDISWTIGDRARVGLVGDNGAGKTTLLKVLAGQIEPDGGSVELAGGAIEIGYLPQDLVELGEGRVIDLLRDRAGLSSLAATLEDLERRISEAREDSPELARMLADHERAQASFDHKGGYEFDSSARKVLRGLGFAAGDGDRLCGEFSGGWRMRIALASVLMQRPDILLLDEPTNHLDSEAMEWLEGWLRDHRGALMFVSHDRRFLEREAEEIAELRRGELTHWTMSYGQYVVERAAARERRERAYLEQRGEIERLQKFVERFRYKATKATQVQSRIKRLERMDVLEAETDAKSVLIKFPEAERSGAVVLNAEGISKRYGDLRVFADVSLTIERGERIALVGANGAGKSTLLRSLSGTERPDSGKVIVGHNVKMAFYSQESAQDLNYAHTIWEEAKRFGSDLTEARKRDLLGAFLFSGDDIYKPVRVLSGGEKSRLALFKLLLSDSNFLMLDEPTNHLDMTTREIFQSALLDYGGTLLIVSHDRWFLDRIATRVIEIKDGSLASWPGNWSDFIARREAAAMAESEPQREAPQQQESDPKKRDKRAEAEARNAASRIRKKFMSRIEPLERKIELAEARRGEIDAVLCDSNASSDGAMVQSLMIERKETEDAIESLYAEWEALSTEMEEAVARSAVG